MRVKELMNPWILQATHNEFTNGSFKGASITSDTCDIWNQSLSQIFSRHHKHVSSWNDTYYADITGTSLSPVRSLVLEKPHQLPLWIHPWWRHHQCHNHAQKPDLWCVEWMQEQPKSLEHPVENMIPTHNVTDSIQNDNKQTDKPRDWPVL